MSYTEMHIGKVAEIAKDKLTKQEKIEYLKSEGIEVDDDDYIDGENYLFVGDKLYKVIENAEHDYDCICQGKLNTNNEIEYILKFYNGGTCFSEMLEEAIQKALKEA